MEPMKLMELTKLMDAMKLTELTARDNGSNAVNRVKS